MDPTTLDIETGIKWFTDPSPALRFVRQIEWQYPHAPSALALTNAMILGYAHCNGKATRVFYLVANMEDGLNRTPDDDDLHGGLPVLVRTIHPRTPPVGYVYSAEAEAVKERKRRSARVAHWEKQRKRDAPKQPKPKRSWLSRLFGGK